MLRVLGKLAYLRAGVLEFLKHLGCQPQVQATSTMNTYRSLRVVPKPAGTPVFVDLEAPIYAYRNKEAGWEDALMGTCTMLQPTASVVFCITNIASDIRSTTPALKIAEAFTIIIWQRDARV